MITINQKGSIVQINIEHGLHSKGNENSVFYFRIDTGEEFYAELLVERFQRMLEDRIMAIRQEEYNRGWKDAKAKRKKSTFFATVLRKIF